MTDPVPCDVLRQRAQSAAAAVHLACPHSALLSLCLPAFNEDAIIGNVIHAARTILPIIVADFEIVVVDDGSIDGTAERVREHVRADSRVRLICHPQNRGYGSAVTTGLRESRGDLVMFMDSDGQFDLLDLPKLLAHIDEYDWVIGYRGRRAEPGLRRFNAWCWSKLISLVLNVSIRDLDCAFKVFHRNVVDALNLSSTGACVNAEILAQCMRHGMRFHEVPVSHFPRVRGKQTGASLRVIYRAFRELPALLKYRCARDSQKNGRITRPSPQFASDPTPPRIMN